MELNEIVFSQIRKKYLEKIVGESFKEILENENHTSQIETILMYLKNRKVCEELLKDVSLILKLEELIFWTIDDVVDREFQKNSKLTYYNEIVKFVSFILLLEAVFKYQLTHKKNFVAKIIGKPLLVEKLLFSIYENLPALIYIPHKEKLIEKMIEKETNEKEVIKLAFKNQWNRSQNLQIYLGTVESLVGIKINKKPFMLFRSLQLIREDLEEIKKDKKNKTNNIFNILMKKYKNRKTVEKTISKIIDEIKKDFKKGTDKNTEFLIKKAENEYKRVCRLLTI
ncbi:MAG: hypothetical protein DRP18_04770 [Candidatus Aenigmatarchaeota archaeon]|nr:MAG: hypothetical protein DRP18_04770 [Candidatus Aenigmarchaeota archaeon]